MEVVGFRVVVLASLQYRDCAGQLALQHNASLWPHADHAQCRLSMSELNMVAHVCVQSQS